MSSLLNGMSTLYYIVQGSCKHVAAVCSAYVAFFAYSPLSSPLLSFVFPMMILSKPLHDMDYELMINTCEELGIIPLALRDEILLSSVMMP